MRRLFDEPKANKKDAGTGSYGICPVIDASRPPSPDPKHPLNSTRSAMKRRELIPMLVGTAALSQTNAGAKDAPKEASDGADRWGFLGDDDALRKTIREAGQVLLVCVYQISLEQVKPPFAQVVFRATVVRTVKGTHRMGDRISIRFMTDSLPGDEAERAKFNEDATARNLGSLKMAFLQGAKADEYGCEWLDVPSFDPDMLNFATKNSR